MPTRDSVFSGTWQVNDVTASPNIIYRFWIQTSIVYADEGTKIGQVNVRVDDGGVVSPCRDLTLVDLSNNGKIINIQYTDGNNVVQDLTLKYFPNAIKQLKLVLTGGNRGLNSSSNTACSAN